MNNLQEFLAGTEPTDAASALRILSLSHDGADLKVSFLTVNGIVYRLKTKGELDAGAWSAVGDDILGNGSLVQITQPGATSLPHQFYRLEVAP